MAGNRCTHCPGSHTGQMPCLASANTNARGWLLIEHPGPWAERLQDSDLPEPISIALDLAARHGVRAQFIRRPRLRRTTPPLQVYLGWSHDDTWLEGRELADSAELAELDLAAVAKGLPPGFGEPVHERLLLVCTHGRHNACCARMGAPLARELYNRFDPCVWETTHVGGDRYSANLICLPHGLYYGNLTVTEALSAVAAYRRDEVALEHYRGRSGLPEPAQAAEHFVRSRTGELEINAVTVESLDGHPVCEAVVRVNGAVRSARYRVRVERAEIAPPCGAECAENLGTYVLQDLTLLNEAVVV